MKMQKYLKINIMCIIIIIMLSQLVPISALPAVIQERTLEIGETESLGNSGYTTRTISYSSPAVEYTPIDLLSFTAQDLKNFTKALKEADYSKFQLAKKGIDYEIKKIELKYNYAIEIVTITNNDTEAELIAEGINSEYMPTDSYHPKYISLTINYLNKNSQLIASIDIFSQFGYNYKKAGVEHIIVQTNSYVNGIDFSNLSAVTNQADLTDLSMNNTNFILKYLFSSDCDIYINPHLVVDNTLIDDLILQISCSPKGFALSKAISKEKSGKDSPYQKAVENQSYKPFESNPYSINAVLPKEDLFELLSDIALIEPYEIKMTVEEMSKLEEIQLQNGYYIELGLYRYKVNPLCGGLEITIKTADGKNVYTGSAGIPDGLVSSNSTDIIADSGIQISVSSTFSSDGAVTANTLNMSEETVNLNFNIEISCDKDGNFTARIGGNK